MRCTQIMGVHTPGEPRWLSLFWGWLQTSAIHFRKHLPLELCFSLSPSVILQKSKITSCGESSCKIMSNKNIACHKTQDNLAWKSWRQKNWSVEIQSPLPSYSPELGRLRCKACRPRCPLCLGRSCSCRKHVSASLVFLSFDTSARRVLSYPFAHPMLWRTKTFSLPWQNEHVAACLQESFGLALWDVLNSCHFEPEERGIHRNQGPDRSGLYLLHGLQPYGCPRLPGFPENKNQPIFFRSSDFKNGTQIKAGEKETNHNKSQQIITIHNKSQQITTDHNGSPQQITFSCSLCKVVSIFVFQLQVTRIVRIHIDNLNSLSTHPLSWQDILKRKNTRNTVWNMI